MRYPLTLCSHNRLIIAPHGWFDRIGNLDAASQTLRISVSYLGVAGFKWLLDANGGFYALDWQGLEPATLLQKLHLARRVEKYSLSGPRGIRAGELARLIENLDEAFDEEVPNSADLHDFLLRAAPDEQITRKFMQEYLGE